MHIESNKMTSIKTASGVETARPKPCQPHHELAEEKLVKNTSRETLGTHSQGSQANFARLPSAHKYGLAQDLN